MFSYHEIRKTIYYYVLCFNFSIETKIKTLFLIQYFNLTKKTKRNATLGTRLISTNTDEKMKNLVGEVYKLKEQEYQQYLLQGKCLISKY